MILLAALTLALTSCVLPTQAVDLEGQLWEQMGTSALEDAAEGTFSVKEGTNLQKGLGVLASQASEQVDAVRTAPFAALDLCCWWCCSAAWAAPCSSLARAP